MIRLSKHSLATRTKSRICLPPTEAFYNLEIRLSSTIFNLLVSTFANNLYTLFTKLIGWKYLILTAFLFLGIKAIKVSLRDLSILQCLQNSRKNSHHISFYHTPTICTHPSSSGKSIILNSPIMSEKSNI